jgi:hypothetical protein
MVNDPKFNEQELLTEAYQHFNARRIDAVLARMQPSMMRFAPIGPVNGPPLIPTSSRCRSTPTPRAALLSRSSKCFATSRVT